MPLCCTTILATWVFHCQVSGLTQSLGESAAKMGEDLQQTVNTLAAFELEVGSVLDILVRDVKYDRTADNSNA